jgi:hypothetical protein
MGAMFPNERGLEEAMFVVRVAEILEDEEHHINTFGPLDSEGDADAFADALMAYAMEHPGIRGVGNLPQSRYAYHVEELLPPHLPK